MNDFDWKTYVNNYTDLQCAGINSHQKAWNHWIRAGKKEGRSYQYISVFDWKNYVNINNLPNTQIIDEHSGITHWLMFGKKNNLQYPNKFNNIIIGKNYNVEQLNINNTMLIIISCHTNSQLKYNVLVNNIKYLQMPNIQIIIINSEEYENAYNYNIANNIIKFFTIKNDKFYDFGKWIYVLTNFDYTKYKNIVFMNDSIILTSNINNDLMNLNNNNFDLYGFNDSTQIAYHYQSFLFSIKSTCINKFIEMFNSKKSFIKKFFDVIFHYEIGLFKVFVNKDCYIKISKLTNGKNLQFQVDQVYSYVLLNDIFPIIKVKRILENKIPYFITETLRQINFKF